MVVPAKPAYYYMASLVWEWVHGKNAFSILDILTIRSTVRRIQVVRINLIVRGGIEGYLLRIIRLSKFNRKKLSFFLSQ